MPKRTSAITGKQPPGPKFFSAASTVAQKAHHSCSESEHHKRKANVAVRKPRLDGDPPQDSHCDQAHSDLVGFRDLLPATGEQNGNSNLKSDGAFAKLVRLLARQAAAEAIDLLCPLGSRATYLGERSSDV